jgi:mutual gliding-motility protein MglA
VLIHYAAREIHAKIVYCGPGLGGKTTNLAAIHGRLPEHARGRMLSIATEGDRTLFFDFLPVDLGLVRGFRVRFHLYPVPGQTFYAASRRVILRGVDGIVLVVDSQAHRLDENRESVADLRRNLARERGEDAEPLPLVVQWNKRDLPTALPIEFLRKELELEGLPSIEAVASEGRGVSDTLKACCKGVLRMMEAAGRGGSASPVPRPPARPPIAGPPPPPRPTWSRTGTGTRR